MGMVSFEVVLLTELGGFERELFSTQIMHPQGA